MKLRHLIFAFFMGTMIGLVIPLLIIAGCATVESQCPQHLFWICPRDTYGVPDCRCGDKLEKELYDEAVKLERESL